MVRYATQVPSIPISGFSFDSSSKDEDCDAAVTQLLRLVEMGKEAQAAIDAIKTTGFYEGVAPVAMEPAPSYHATLGSYHAHHIRYAVFQERQSISRADLPMLNGIKLVYGVLKPASYGGHACHEIQLHVDGMVARQIDKLGTVEFVQATRKIGSIRINKHHLSFVEDGFDRKTVTIPKNSLQSSKNQESATVFARNLGRFIADVIDPEIKGADWTKFALVAKMLDLQLTSPSWFIADGVVERMFNEIHANVCILEVMES